jgi:hypothetical protein
VAHLAADAVADAVVLLVAVVACLRHRGAQEERGLTRRRRQSTRIRPQRGRGRDEARINSPPEPRAPPKKPFSMARPRARAGGFSPAIAAGRGAAAAAAAGGASGGWLAPFGSWPSRSLGFWRFPLWGRAALCRGGGWGVITGEPRGRIGKTWSVCAERETWRPIIAVWVVAGLPLISIASVRWCVRAADFYLFLSPSGPMFVWDRDWQWDRVVEYSC